MQRSLPGFAVLLSVFLLGSAAWSQDNPPTKDQAIVIIKGLGGLYSTVDEKPDQPVVVVNLVNTKAADSHVAALRAFPKLEWLNLGGTMTTDAGLAHLKGLTELNTLYLNDTKVTDAGLANLKGLSKLSTLGLTGTGIGDAGLAHLKDLKKLGRIYLFETKVTDEGIKELRKAVPGVRIMR
jgi:hypothetical protein